MNLGYEVACADPVLILNPSIVDLVCHRDFYYLDGRKYNISPGQKYMVASGDSPRKVLHLPYVSSTVQQKDGTEIKRYLLSEDPFLENSYFVSEDGEIDYIYIYVPCGKCSVCASKLMSSFVQRANFAVQETREMPYFVTLKYNNAHLPTVEQDGVNHPILDVRDVQLFQKKLRIQVARMWRYYAPAKPNKLDPNYDKLIATYNHTINSLKNNWSSKSENIKFVYSGELGPKTGRPHWHVIIFGLPIFNIWNGEFNETFNSYFTMHLLMYAWRDGVRKSNGLFETFFEYRQKYPIVYKRPSYYDPYSRGYITVKPIKSYNVVGYVLKYAFKHYIDKDSSIYGSSHNLGVNFVNSHFDEILANPDHKLVFRDFLTQDLKEVNLCSYYLAKLMPSKSKLIPVDIRKAYRDLHVGAIDLFNNEATSITVKRILLRMIDFVDERYPWLKIDMFSSVLKYVKLEHKSWNIDGFITEDEIDFYMRIQDPYPEFVANPIMELFSYVEQCYKILLNSNIDIGIIQEKLDKRNLFYSSFKKRTRSEILISGLNFRDQVSKNHSITKLN